MFMSELEDLDRWRQNGRKTFNSRLSALRQGWHDTFDDDDLSAKTVAETIDQTRIAARPHKEMQRSVVQYVYHPRTS